jgi:hypothetical protein
MSSLLIKKHDISFLLILLYRTEPLIMFFADMPRNHLNSLSTMTFVILEIVPVFLRL